MLCFCIKKNSLLASADMSCMKIMFSHNEGADMAVGTG